jgi:hypothetical protein
VGGGLHDLQEFDELLEETAHPSALEGLHAEVQEVDVDEIQQLVLFQQVLQVVVEVIAGQVELTVSEVPNHLFYLAVFVECLQDLCGIQR